MNEYHKIQTVFLRNPDTKFKTLLYGRFALPEFEYLADNEWGFTEKVDGTNIRIMFNGISRLEFGGKTDNAQIPPFLVEKLSSIFWPKLSMFQELFPDGVCLYGEGYGARIQKGGGKYRPDQSFVLFDVKIKDWWLERSSVVDISKKLEIEVVPQIGTGTLWEMARVVEEGFPSRWGNFIMAEGIVARPMVELKNKSGNRIITKIKHKDFE